MGALGQDTWIGRNVKFSCSALRNQCPSLTPPGLTHGALEPGDLGLHPDSGIYWESQARPTVPVPGGCPFLPAWLSVGIN